MIIDLDISWSSALGGIPWRLNVTDNKMLIRINVIKHHFNNFLIVKNHYVSLRNHYFWDPNFGSASSSTLTTLKTSVQNIIITSRGLIKRTVRGHSIITPCLAPHPKTTSFIVYSCCISLTYLSYPLSIPNRKKKIVLFMFKFKIKCKQKNKHFV